MKINITDIQQGRRHRKNNGDLGTLKASITELGLLHPIGLNSRKELIYGGRRLAACMELGWKEIPATILATLNDAVTALKAERDENECREPMAVSELVALGKELEEVERPAAAQRKAANAPQNQANPERENFPFGKTADKVGDAIGMSGKTYEKAKAVVETGVPELIAAVDAEDVSISAAAEVAKLPKAEQKKIVKAGPDAVKAKAADIRKAAKPKPVEPVIEPESAPVESEQADTAEVESPAKPYKVPKVDANGIPIQEWAVEAFEAVPEFRDMIRVVKALRQRLSALADTVGGRYLQRNCQWTTLGKNPDGSERGAWRNDHLENLLMLLEDRIPMHTDCPYAFNPFKAHDDACNCCKGMRWTPKQHNKNTPRECLAARDAHYGIEGGK